ncbi:hypothetical protein Pen01_76830 [Phytomonospora endophytica]|nr:hypothetical protein Pen01_76830 [Phytomonospora endophytica]
MLEVRQVLRRAGAGVEAGLVAGGALADLLDLAFLPGDVAIDVADRRLGLRVLVLRRAGGGVEALDLGVLGKVAAAVVELVEGGVAELQVKQPSLVLRVGLQLSLAPRSRVACRADGAGAAGAATVVRAAVLTAPGRCGRRAGSTGR